MVASKKISETGVLYIASGEEYVQSATESAQRVKECTTADICLISSTDSVPEVFDHTISPVGMNYSFRDKVEYISRTPFEKTVFLDADTWLVSEFGIIDLFEVLEYVEFVATLGIHRVSSNPQFDPPDLPESLPMFSTGVFAFRDTLAVRKLFEKWADQYNSYSVDAPPDQPAFRSAIASSDVRYSILPREYNFIISSAQTVSRDVKILHGNAANHKEIAEAINNYSYDVPRFYQPLYTSSPPPSADRRIIPRLGTANRPGLMRLTAQSVREIGIGWTLLCWAAGGPAVGRSRLELIQKTAEEDGWMDVVQMFINHIVQ